MGENIREIILAWKNINFHKVIPQRISEMKLDKDFAILPDFKFFENFPGVENLARLNFESELTFRVFMRSKTNFE